MNKGLSKRLECWPPGGSFTPCKAAPDQPPQPRWLCDTIYCAEESASLLKKEQTLYLPRSFPPLRGGGSGWGRCHDSVCKSGQESLLF